MKKNLIKHGNSVALVIDRPILDLLNISADTTFEITTDGRNIILSPQADTHNEQDILKSLEKINSRYKNALRKLGE
jgi:antitoxin component of MazEF toxin-antitoxin module